MFAFARFLLIQTLPRAHLSLLLMAMRWCARGGQCCSLRQTSKEISLQSKIYTRALMNIYIQQKAPLERICHCTNSYYSIVEKMCQNFTQASQRGFHIVIHYFIFSLIFKKIKVLTVHIKRTVFRAQD